MIAQKVSTSRWYQKEAVEAIRNRFRKGHRSSLIVMPTGAGKTHVIAELARLNSGRTLILAHVKELLQQAYEKLIGAGLSRYELGIYCAALKRKEHASRIVIASIQSAHRAARKLGKFELVIVDEAHMIKTSEDATYFKTISAIDPRWLVGLTATPYRLDHGLIYGKDNQLFDGIDYEVPISRLVKEGYLCKLTNKATGLAPSLSGARISGGDFNLSDLNTVIDSRMIENSCKRIIEAARDRSKVLVFCCTIKHAEMVSKQLPGSEIVTSESSRPERDKAIEDFRVGAIKYLVNVNVLTLGFDAPDIDCVAILRPTISPGLFYQMVGRGLRVHPSKKDCLILDFGKNFERHGTIDDIRPPLGDGTRPKKDPTEEDSLVKRCHACGSLMPLSAKECTDCGAALSEPRHIRHDTYEDDSSDIFSGRRGPGIYLVYRHKLVPVGSRRTGHMILKCIYFDHDDEQIAFEFVCFGYKGYAGYRARKWWLARGGRYPIPKDGEEAFVRSEEGEISVPFAIKVDRSKNPKYPTIEAVGAEEYAECPS